MKFSSVGLRHVAVLGVLTLAACAVSAQVIKAPRYQGGVEAPVQQVNLPALPPAITPHGTVVEDVVVRVNDQIISRSDVERSQQQLQQESAQANLPPGEFALRQKDMLRDMIDQQLLLSRAKELSLNADADVIRRLDEIRKQNKMETLDDLEKAARQQGVSFEDFKAQIRNQILTQQVVRDEVGRRLQLSAADETRYYNEHKSDFEQPEQIRLSEILVPLPENATPVEIVQAERKANDLKTQVMQGTSFADVAKKSSGGPSAAQGGELGLFKRGALAKVLEDQTFDLKVGESTQPVRTRQGFVILKVTEHNAPGAAPMKEVEQQIQEAMYMQAMQPALRKYLTKLREESYIDIQSGFVDSGSSSRETKPVFTAYAPPPVKKKKPTQKARFDRNGRSSSAIVAKAVVASPDTTGGRTITGPEAKSAVDPNTGLAVLAPVALKTNGKPAKRMKREKVRFGQAPRNSLGVSPDDTQVAEATPAVAPGAAMSSLGLPAQSSSSVDLTDNPLTPREAPKVKSRFSARAKEEKDKKVQTVSAKKAEKIAAKPIAMTADEKATTTSQAAPLGLSGDTSRKPKKVKKVKGAVKIRLQEKQPEVKKVAEPVDQTANPALAPTDTTPSSTSAPVPTAPTPKTPQP